MAANIDTSKSSDAITEFFRTEGKSAIIEIDNAIEDLIGEYDVEYGSSIISNVILFDFITNIQDDLNDYWEKTLLIKIKNDYQKKFGLKFSDYALTAGRNEFIRGLEKSIDVTIKMVLKWPGIDFYVADMDKIARNIKQMLKSTLRKSFHAIQDKSTAPLSNRNRNFYFYDKNSDTDNEDQINDEI